MPDASATILYYVHDPMCSWCYGFAPVWRELKERLSAKVSIVSQVGGLAPDCDEPMAEGMRAKLQDTWRHIGEEIPGTVFNFDFWSRNTPRRSTYPACRAVICARDMADKETQMTAAIQQAYYRDARNPSDMETLVELADSIGIDKQAFAQRMQSAQLETKLRREIEFVRGIGGYSFPSLILVRGERHQDVKIDYHSARQLSLAIERLLGADLS